MSRKKKYGDIAALGKWVPVSLDFLKSRAAAQLSPHACKLFVDLLSMLGANAWGNGDISITPKTMWARGWTSKASLYAAVQELEDADLLVLTRQGSRPDCSLYAITLYPIDCDIQKLDAGAGPGSYTRTDWERHGKQPPSEQHPAQWRRVRKTQTLPPPRNPKGRNSTATEPDHVNKGHSSPATEPQTPNLANSQVPPRGTYVHMPCTDANLRHGDKGANTRTGQIAPTWALRGLAANHDKRMAAIKCLATARGIELGQPIEALQ